MPPKAVKAQWKPKKKYNAAEGGKSTMEAKEKVQYRRRGQSDETNLLGIGCKLLAFKPLNP